MFIKPISFIIEFFITLLIILGFCYGISKIVIDYKENEKLILFKYKEGTCL